MALIQPIGPNGLGACFGESTQLAHWAPWSPLVSMGHWAQGAHLLRPDDKVDLRVHAVNLSVNLSELLSEKVCVVEPHVHHVLDHFDVRVVIITARNGRVGWCRQSWRWKWRPHIGW